MPIIPIELGESAELTEELCPCGRPLHYTSPSLRLMVEGLIRDLGSTLTVTTPVGSWLVPRHYVALHGIRAEDLPLLADVLGFERVPLPRRN